MAEVLAIYWKFVCAEIDWIFQLVGNVTETRKFRCYILCRYMVKINRNDRAMLAARPASNCHWSGWLLLAGTSLWAEGRRETERTGQHERSRDPERDGRWTGAGGRERARTRGGATAPGWGGFGTLRRRKFVYTQRLTWITLDKLKITQILLGSV